MKSILATLIAIFALPILALAQDPAFSLPLSAPAHLNPALTGLQGHSNVRLSYRNQWPALSANYQTMYFASNFYLAKTNGVAGINFVYDNAGSTIKASRLSINYGQNFRLGEEFVIKPAIEVTYFSKVLDWENLTFGDMIDPRTGFVDTTTQQRTGGTVSGVDFSAGMVSYYKGAMVGFSARHLTEPNESLVNGNSPLPMHIAFQASYVIQFSDNGNFTLQPFFVSHLQGGFAMLELGLGAKFKQFFAFVGYRNKDSYVGGLGVQIKNFDVSYTYDLTVSQLTIATAGSHEVSLNWKFLKTRAPHDNFVKMRGFLF